MKFKSLVIAVGLSATLIACGGGGSSNTPEQSEPPVTGPLPPVIPNPEPPVTNPQPPLEGYIYIAKAPYAPTIGDRTVGVDIGAPQITYAFGGSVPFYNPTSGRSDIHTINVWDPVNKRSQVVQGWQLKNDGIKDRVFKQDGYTAIGVIAGDGIVEEKLRTQANAFPISTRRHYVWELKFKVGGRSLNNPWHLAPAGESPGTVWQLKTPSYGPALLMGLDSDPKNAGKLEIGFDARVNPSQGGVRIGALGNIDPAGENDVRIEAYLDEREAAQGGQGFLKITVNGKLIVDKKGPNVQAGASSPYNWSMGMYLWKNTVPLSYDRFIYYKTARLVILD